MPLIILMDIDHTLIDNAGVSKDIYAAEFATLTGCPPGRQAETEAGPASSSCGGMVHQHRWPEPEWPAIEDALARAATNGWTTSVTVGLCCLAWREAPTAVSVMTGWVSTVLTGNTVANACLKLSAFNLDLLLDLDAGAYSAEAEDRPDLVAVALSAIGSAQ